MADGRPRARAGPRIHPRVDWAAAYAWRLLVIGVAIAALLWVLGQLIVVVISIVAAVLLTRALVGPARWLTKLPCEGAPLDSVKRKMT